MESGWVAPIALVGVCVLSWLWSLLTAPGFNVRSKHVLLTGAEPMHLTESTCSNHPNQWSGSLLAGTENPLGLAIAKKYASKGAKVSLIGPSTEALKAAQSELQTVTKGDVSGFTFECELTDVKQVEQAVQEANAFHGRPTDHVVYGASRRIRPGYFWEQDVALMKEAMDVNYHGAVVLVKVGLLLL
ncbi:unnamed protein product [Phytophthora fragariaefolia]|uniref:Unnamed protein product n=1 Tax=Phytophthora fragariaefolia TaxID=1490495 RepID=A0A9W6TVC6_9STRA|nr:unnamed protein product [Phytophthora fragariaefolia]